jgi:flagellar hook-associated protein 1
MTTLFSGISMSLQSLLAQQQAMEVIEHNVANVNTPGYHRQSVILMANLPISVNWPSE